MEDSLGKRENSVHWNGHRKKNQGNSLDLKVYLKPFWSQRKDTFVWAKIRKFLNPAIMTLDDRFAEILRRSEKNHYGLER
jgi:hypothetical protein